MPAWFPLIVDGGRGTQQHKTTKWPGTNGLCLPRRVEYWVSSVPSNHGRCHLSWDTPNQEPNCWQGPIECPDCARTGGDVKGGEALRDKDACSGVLIKTQIKYLHQVTPGGSGCKNCFLNRRSGRGPVPDDGVLGWGWRRSIRDTCKRSAFGAI
ncbi:hypothetical protein AVEN_176304-1 [Araneus ventricosus]|uniref:Uncharacterized protein n=1 Tax=Araneus ventricosus TaxID=182803 RepID=A0A4Y2KQK1_ARAVE|nr:hypothetical protein AVEN_1859-1 [Araneus ventricosus]GBN03560.1 hypothetical protein AVEN_148308-1 [Araneus ventricosus]GBN03573.1 hypothetical protein AVEN_157250-1 [Araneus ventricosus]GBN03586.1 hypothetical protein AVEN_176304-1 [Araneus ventricosus]